MRRVGKRSELFAQQLILFPRTSRQGLPSRGTGVRLEPFPKLTFFEKVIRQETLRYKAEARDGLMEVDDFILIKTTSNQSGAYRRKQSSRTDTYWSRPLPSHDF